MSDNDLIRRGDAFAVVKGLRLLEEDIRNLPAVTVGVPLKQIGTGLYEQPAPPSHIRTAPMGDMIDRDAVIARLLAYGTASTEKAAEAIAALPAVTQPAPTAQLDAGDVKEAWEKAYWRLRSYAVHDNDCKLNKPPRFDGPCSCGLTAALEEVLALLEKPHDRA